LASLLRDQTASSAAILATFGDDALVRAALDFEAALAGASAAEGLITPDAAHIIGGACGAIQIDVAALADEAAHAGTIAIPLVRRLREHVARRSQEAALLVHMGATSQDLADTALMLQAKAGAALIVVEAQAVTDALARLAEVHAETPMLGRTLLQAAAPITFGLKAAGWMLGLDAALQRFEREAAEALRLQLGGATGTLAGLNLAVVARVASELGLEPATVPWHSRRDGIAGLAAALAILIGAAGKVARDISLLAQNELAEAFEPRAPGRGGSSAMPLKRNPTGCQIVLSAAIRAPALACAILSGLPQEHERGLGGWQAEGPGLAMLFELAHGALCALRPVVDDLEVDTAAMRRNLSAADVGDDLGHAIALVHRALAEHRGTREAGP
jgi:3-carboxy-cis,cis-muconate cycloisomerase